MKISIIFASSKACFSANRRCFSFYFSCARQASSTCGAPGGLRKRNNVLLSFSSNYGDPILKTVKKSVYRNPVDDVEDLDAFVPSFLKLLLLLFWLLLALQIALWSSSSLMHFIEENFMISEKRSKHI